MAIRETSGGVQRNICDEGHRPQDSLGVQKIRQGGDGSSKRNDRRRKSGKDKETIIKPVWPDDYIIPGFPPYHVEDAGIIYCADCRDILPHLPKVDLVLTDPPYGKIGGSKSIGGSNIVNVNSYDLTWDIKLEQWEMTAIVSKGYAAIIWGGNYYMFPPTNSLLIWDKKIKNGWNDNFSDGELAWTNIKTPLRIFRHLWMGCLRKHGDIRKHPTEKPIELMKWCLGFSDGNIVLDPFLGSGTTAVAAKELGRKFIGIEIEEKYCEIAVKRLRQGVLNFDR